MLYIYIYNRYVPIKRKGKTNFSQPLLKKNSSQIPKFELLEFFFYKVEPVLSCQLSSEKFGPELPLVSSLKLNKFESPARPSKTRP